MSCHLSPILHDPGNLTYQQCIDCRYFTRTARAADIDHLERLDLDTAVERVKYFVVLIGANVEFDAAAGAPLPIFLDIVRMAIRLG